MELSLLDRGFLSETHQLGLIDDPLSPLLLNDLLLMMDLFLIRLDLLLSRRASSLSLFLEKFISLPIQLGNLMLFLGVNLVTLSDLDLVCLNDVLFLRSVLEHLLVLLLESGDLCLSVEFIDLHPCFLIDEACQFVFFVFDSDSDLHGLLNVALCGLVELNMLRDFVQVLAMKLLDLSVQVHRVGLDNKDLSLDLLLFSLCQLDFLLRVP